MAENVTEVKDTTKAPAASSTKKTNKKDEARYANFIAALATVNEQLKPKKGDTPGEEVRIGFLSDMQVDVERFSSGSVILDSITGGGIPRGRIIEIYGPESSGKTSIALNCVANVQRSGGNAVFLDVEQALDPAYAKILGVDVDRLALSQPSIAEDIFRMIMELVKSGAVDLIVVDSVASMATRAEAEADIEKAQVASLARLMSKALKLLVKPCQSHNCTIIFLNQTRENVGQMFGNPEVTPGGKALKFYASQRIRVKRSKIIKDGDESIGTEVELKVIKNKTAAPFGVGQTVLTFKKGINRPAEILVVGEDYGIIEKVGRSYYFPSTTPVGGVKPEDGKIKIASSQAEAVAALGDNKELFDIIATKLDTILREEREGA